MVEKQVKIGLLGCGPIAQFAHLPALPKAHQVHLAAVCDGAEDLLRAVSGRIGVEQQYTDYEAFLKEADIDAVLIAVADPFHVPLAIEALRAGKHVLVEKPLGTHSQECEQLIRVVDQTGLKLQVGSMKRHDPGIEFARRFVQERLGDILSVSGWYCDTQFRPAMQDALLPELIRSERAIRSPDDPKADKRHYSLVTHGAHLFDILRYLGGTIVGVTAQLSDKFDQHSWHGLLEFDHGGRGHFELTVKVNSDWSEGYIVRGEHGSVEVKTFLPFHHRASQVSAFDARTEQWHSPLGADSDPYRRQLEAFARSILYDEPVNPDAHEGMAAVSLLEAVEISVAKRGRVGLRQTSTAT